MFFGALRSLISTNPALLKVMLVMERIPDEYEMDECRDLAVSSLECRKFGRLDWDQKTKGA